MPEARRARRKAQSRAIAPVSLLAILFMLLITGCAALPVRFVHDIDDVRTGRDLSGAWYAGDLHMHTRHSDGDSSIATVVARAEGRGLDFVVVSDHDTSVRGQIEHWDDPGFRSESMVLLYGAEWTSEDGHAIVFAAQPFDYARLWAANRARDPAAAVAAAHAGGALFSVNHPVAPCCPWEYGLTGAGGAFIGDAMEVWNAPFAFPNGNAGAVRIWDGLLSRGLQVTAVGGSDSHETVGLQSRVNLPGAPTTWVFAAARSGEAIVAAIREGRVSLSYLPYADRLELVADSDGDGTFDAMMGDEIAAGTPTTFAVSVAGPYRREAGLGDGEFYECEVIKNGTVLTRFVLRSAAPRAATFVDTPMPGDYYRAVLRGTPRVGFLQGLFMGRTLALTNPIYAR